MQRIPEVPFGVARARTLVDAGLTRRELRRLVELGSLTRIGHGWYAAPDARRDVCEAIGRGGRLSCVSALALHGTWEPPRPGIHVRLLGHAASGRSLARRLPSRVHRCRAPGPHALVDFGPVDPVDIALATASRCTTPEYLVAIMDSMLRTGRHTATDLARMLQHCPAEIRALVHRTNIADAGTESLVRFRLESHRIPVRPQVTIHGVGRVDLLVGRRLVLEIDSQAHHNDPVAYVRDRERDLALTRLGYDRLRLTYEHVMHRWDEAFASIRTITRRGAHLRAPRRAR